MARAVPEEARMIEESVQRGQKSPVPPAKPGGFVSADEPVAGRTSREPSGLFDAVE
jgi:hypothetical protein